MLRSLLHLSNKTKSILMMTSKIYFFKKGVLLRNDWLSYNRAQKDKSNSSPATTAGLKKQMTIH